MTTVNSKLVNLKPPSIDGVYSLDEFIRSNDIVPIELFSDLEEAKLFLEKNKRGMVSVPGKSDLNPSRYVAYLKANVNELGVVTINTVSYAWHVPNSDEDKRPIDGDEWVRGDVVYNLETFRRYDPISWICTESGLPGSWLVQGFTHYNYSDLQVVDMLPDANELQEGRLVQHRISDSNAEICYCAQTGPDKYEWKSILAYDIAHPPSEGDDGEDDPFGMIPVSTITTEFSKPEGPNKAVIHDNKDYSLNSDGLQEYDRISQNKVPSYTEDSIYYEGITINPTDNLDTLISGTYYCPYDFSTYSGNKIDGAIPDSYPPTLHPVKLTAQQFTRIVNDTPETIVLQKSTDVVTGQEYARCGKLTGDSMTKDMLSISDSSLYEWHTIGAEPITSAHMTELINIIKE